ncbi:Unknown protein [Striga hermonthica]|uniref:Myb/SANT-like domain-containing protein n=1 Tax=Striga hermonthica TaxID=68872 RepID=A0A9N7RGL8_STRHE|nr:Unknown protein [Striga hermonthica]
MDHQPQETRGRGKSKRKWNNEEDAKLVEAFLEMVNLGTYKAENGFKPGYLNYVEDKLRVSLPSSGFKAKPHIESRIKTLKRDFNIVYDMLNGPNTSGFDRATGGNTEGPNDMMEDIQREDVNLNADNDVEATSGIGLDDLDASFSPLQSPRSAAVDKRKKRKRSVDNLTAMIDIKEAASLIGSEIAKASEIFGKAIGVDAEISEKRQRIDSEIRKIPNLAVVDVIKVVCRIAQSPELTDEQRLLLRVSASAWGSNAVDLPQRSEEDRRRRRRGDGLGHAQAGRQLGGAVRNSIYAFLGFELDPIFPQFF